MVLYCKLDGALFTAQSLRGVEAPAQAKEIARLRVEQKAYTTGPEVKIIKNDEIMIGKNPGLDFTTEGPSPQGNGRVTSRIRIFFANGIFYTLTTMSRTNSPLPQETDRFLRSFKLEDSDKNPKKPGEKLEKSR